ncbi:hypothetical protein V9T40_010120 [Parthenolecanium corni]|uniref:Uncharacterized protein n=1 Tax=Parthenolecanium corni TaxID=536013 RepID=A0AAN9TJH6_9HEMI
MAPPLKDKLQLLDAEFLEEVDEKCSQQPDEPPSYAVATGPSSKPNQIDDSSNKSNGNSLALAFSQPSHGPYYGYTNLEPTIGQYSIPGDISAISPGQPTFSMPGTGLPAASGQHLIINQYGAYYCPPVETQRQNVGADTPVKILLHQCYQGRRYETCEQTFGTRLVA